MDTNELEIESHPFESYIPDGARAVLMGTFPPQRHRWCMEWFYPNRTNDFWRIMSLIFLGDPLALYNAEAKTFYVDRIKQVLNDHHIAMATTAMKIRRLQGNAADKHLEIVEPVDLPALLARIPDCRALGTTGEKAAEIIAQATSTPLPKIGVPILTDNWPEIWRLPSTSRAYPLALEKKAVYYAEFFRAAGCL